jgi:hypothetical protein
MKNDVGKYYQNHAGFAAVSLVYQVGTTIPDKCNQYLFGSDKPNMHYLNALDLIVLCTCACAERTFK